jgi:hypothetical protein
MRDAFEALAISFAAMAVAGVFILAAVLFVVGHY